MTEPTEELEPWRVERALFQYRLIRESDYEKRVPLEFDQLGGEEQFLPAYIFDICDHYGLPMTNNWDRFDDAIEMSDFIGSLYKALEASGWVSPQQHQRALEEARRSAH